MKKLLAILIMLFILCVIPAMAEPRYILPEGWFYNSEGQIVSPQGNVYDSITEHGCPLELSMIDWGYNDKEWLKTMEIPETGDTAELGDHSISLGLLAGTAAVMLAGAAYARRKANDEA